MKVDKKQVFLLCTVTHQPAKGRYLRGSGLFSFFKDYLFERARKSVCEQEEGQRERERES